MSRYRRRRDLELSGRVALVTGGARGIGFETARSLHSRGAHVAILDVDRGAAQVATKALEAGPGACPAIGLAADVTDPDSLDQAISEIADRLGPVEICVANAGIASHAATVRAMDPEAFRRVIEVNFLGVWQTARTVLPSVIEQRGHLVLVSSIYAFTNGAFVSPYACSKAAVEQLGRALRVELAQHGVGCGVAYFGFVDTEMVRQGFERDDLGRRLEALLPERFRSRITAEDAAEAIVTGIERRRPRIIEPRRWRPLSLLRGVVGPLSDRTLMRHRGFQRLAGEADRSDRLSVGETTTSTAGSDGVEVDPR